MKQLSYRQPDFADRVRELNGAAETPREITQQVRQIISQVKTGGDMALVEINNRFSSTPITRAELTLKHKPRVPGAKVKEALTLARRNIEKFYRARIPKSSSGKNAEGATVGEIYQPLRRVGIYVPGGTAPLVSSALMTVTLAKTAGVPEIVVCTPGPVNPVLYYAIRLAGATEVYQVGGAQAVAAMACGTSSIRAVNKIYGPGNVYVVEAKRQVFGRVGIDLLPGPSEVAVLADDSARPAFVAADMLAQAEHGPRSRIFLVSVSERLIEQVRAELERQIQSLDRVQYLRETLNLGCWFVLVRDLKQGVAVIEQIAPEHLSLACKGARKLAAEIHHCGGIFVGDYSPVAAGDYAAGPSHVYPTGGSAVTFSGLTIDQFFRKTSFIHYDKAALQKGAKTIETLALAEGLTAHQRSVAIRFGNHELT
ncbi:MAG: histidinol dehydrogenase [Verrucomicrobiales bacterium]|jgi:histidinol dehydrogenase|nr:histidinol dehydrogenase [Verrucomicrobiales bacterium]